MSQTAADIVKTACQIAKVPGYLSYAGSLLNGILEELWQVNNFAFSRQKTAVDCTQAQPQDGYLLPSDHQRTLEVFYVVNDAPQAVTQVPIEQYDGLFQGASLSSYPQMYCVDVAQAPNTILFYPRPPLAVSVTIRYLPQKPDIVTPETSAEVPWFPGRLYLTTRLAGELMMISDDQRRDSFLKSAEGMLSKFLIMGEDDRENYVRRVRLDPLAFKTSSAAKATKDMPL